MKLFTINCHPSTDWKIRVVIHQNFKKLRQARESFSCSKQVNHNAIAFCVQNSGKDAEHSGNIAEIHLTHDAAGSTVVHESSHAAIQYAKLLRLNVETVSGDELFAETLEHIVCGATECLKLANQKGKKK